MVEDADLVVAAFGLMSRIAKRAVMDARQKGIKVGLIRPVTLWPFPEKAFQEAAEHVSKFLSVEISMGQMVEDIRLAVNGRVPVEFYGRIGLIPNPEEITRQIMKIAQQEGWV
jgi:2-oxoglutarate ferredoxin oxidoreductase subunit alpha